MSDIINKIEKLDGDAIKASKKALRKTVKALQRGLTPEYVEYADRQICLNILSMDEYKSAQAVFCFVGTKDEIDTTDILKQILADGKKLLVPKCRPKEASIEKAGTSAVSNSAGIMDAFEITA